MSQSGKNSTRLAISAGELALLMISSDKRILFPTVEQGIYFGIEHLEQGRLIGVVSIWFHNAELDLAEFTVLIQPNCRRQGYGTEAVRGLLAYAFNGLHVRRMLAHCDSRNVAVRAMLLKVGMRQEAHYLKDEFVKGEWINNIGFALLREEFVETKEPSY